MPGHTGNVSRTTQNLKVVKILPEKNLFLVKGSIQVIKVVYLLSGVSKKVKTFQVKTDEIEFFNADGSSSGEKEIASFPTFEGEKVTPSSDNYRNPCVNQRQGNASTKLRSEVSGSGKKIYCQKDLELEGRETKKQFNAVVEV